MKRFLCIMTLSLSTLRAGDAGDSQALPLAGEWRFHRDEQKAGITAKWFANELPKPADGPATVRLPGTTDEAKAGIPNPKKPSLDGLYRPNIYTGAAWYQREIEIPSAWKNKRVTLKLERVHWETQVWVDDKLIGSRDSLSAPHVFDLGTDLAPGKHRLTIRVDNSLKYDLGLFVSAYYEGTQTNWNGIVGKIELSAADPVAIAGHPGFSRRGAQAGKGSRAHHERHRQSGERGDRAVGEGATGGRKDGGENGSLSSGWRGDACRSGVADGR